MTVRQFIEILDVDNEHREVKQRWVNVSRVVSATLYNDSFLPANFRGKVLLEVKGMEDTEIWVDYNEWLKVVA